MKILVLGAGAIGGYYGARIMEAGGDVTFLVRPARADALAAHKLRIRSQLGDADLPVRTLLAEQLAESYDAVILTCKTYDLQAAMDDIAPAVGPDTVILPFLNGMSAYDALDARFGKEKILGGVAYIATQLDDAGVIHHTGANDLVIIGARSEGQNVKANHLLALLSKSRGIRTLSQDITQHLWDKWVMLASGAAMNCLARGSVAEIMATGAGGELMNRVMRESSRVAEMSGYPPSEEAEQRMRKLLLDAASPWAASMMRDIAQGKRKLEADAIVGDLIARAKQHDIDVPVLSAAYCSLEVYMRRMGGQE